MLYEHRIYRSKSLEFLYEATSMDSRSGRWANAGLGKYLVPVNANTPDIDVEFVNVHNEIINLLDVEGCGEIR